MLQIPCKLHRPHISLFNVFENINRNSYHVNVFLNAANPTSAHVNINKTLYNDESHLGR